MVLGLTEVDLEAVFCHNGVSMQPQTVSDWAVSIAQPFDTLSVSERLGLMLLISRLVRVSTTAIERKDATNSLLVEDITRPS